MARTGLAGCIDRADGLSSDIAVDRAELSLEMVRDKVTASLTDALAEIRTAAAALPAAPSEDQFKAVQIPAVHIAGHAAMCGLDELGRAAYSLCELIDHNRKCDQFDPHGVELHVQTMQLLLRPGAVPLLARSKLNAALEELVAHARKCGEDCAACPRGAPSRAN